MRISKMYVGKIILGTLSGLVPLWFGLIYMIRSNLLLDSGAYRHVFGTPTDPCIPNNPGLKSAREYCEG